MSYINNSNAYLSLSSVSESSREPRPTARMIAFMGGSPFALRHGRKGGPKDCVVLTLACGKFRFFDKQLGDIDGIPRLLDVGQCNDAYSAIQIALALAKAFNCDVNELPLSMILSWYEQKAVAILLTLLFLGVRDIRLGPSLPAFITLAMLQIPSKIGRASCRERV